MIETISIPIELINTLNASILLMKSMTFYFFVLAIAKIITIIRDMFGGSK